MPDQPIEVQPTTAQSMDDIIGNPPGWLLRIGISMVGVVFLIILALSAMIKYPDKVTAPGKLTNKNPPVAHFARIQGVVDSIYVSDGDLVEVGDPLIYIQNTLEKKDLDALRKVINDFNTATSQEEYRKLKFPQNLALGELSQPYGRLKFLLEDFQLTLKQNGIFQQISTLENEIKETKRLREVLLTEKNYAKEELDLVVKDYQRNEALNEEGVISDYEKEIKEGGLLSTQKQYSNLERGVIQNVIREEQLNLEIQRLRESRTAKIINHVSGINEQINSIEQAIRAWDEMYILRAENAGKVILDPDVQPDQKIRTDFPLINIVKNDGKDEVYARLITSAVGLGRMEIGDEVILKLQAYPYKEFGVITSTLTKISALPERDAAGNPIYELEAALSNDLMTSYGKKIPFNHEAGLIGEIITEDKTLLARILNQFLSLLKNK